VSKDRSRSKSQKNRNDETRLKKDTLSSSKITFSFVNFIGKDSKGIGQTWDEWNQKDPNRIIALLNKLQHLGSLNTNQAKEEKSLTVCGSFPPDSKFTCPDQFEKITTWGVVRRFSGKLRAPGFYDGQGVFHIVFLDEDHVFWPSEK